MAKHFGTIGFVLLALLAVGSPPQLSGQDVRDALLESFQGVERKVLRLAEAIPEGSYLWSPGAGVRSVNQVLMHLVGANYLVLGRIGAEVPDGTPEVWHRDPESVAEKSEVLEALRTSFGFARGILEQTPPSSYEDPAPRASPPTSVVRQLILLDAHAHEHLGQLIAYARVNGIVPPWSRAR